MQNRVFVINKDKKPLMPCHPARARELLTKGEAAVWRRFPFTIILKKDTTKETQPVQLGIDPGSRKTGMSLISFNQRGPRVIFGCEIEHKGLRVKKLLEKRCSSRSSRRNRKTRYRQPRFSNRTKPKDWIAPSLRSRIDNVTQWTSRFQRLCPLYSIAVEVVKFDMHKLQGTQYQQGTLQGYNIREYLLEKFNRTCVYCKKKNIPLQIEHIVPKSRDGSNQLNNLAIACERCNQKKCAKTAAEFGFPGIQEKVKRPLRDAAAVNTTRKFLFEALKDFKIPVDKGTGYQTKYNRSVNKYPKGHWVDAACVGALGSDVYLDPALQCLEIKAMGRGSRQMCRVDKNGFPRTKAKTRLKNIKGFQTGDLVKAIITKGKKVGTYVGRLSCRTRGSFDIVTSKGKVSGINHKHCHLLQQADGYQYNHASSSD